MPSHLSSIGLSAADPLEFEELADRVRRLAQPLPTARGTYWHWCSACGAELWLQTNRQNELIGMTPCFRGNARIRVRITERLRRETDTELDGAVHAWADPESADAASGAYPFVFEVADYARHEQLALPATAEVNIAAFAHEIAVYPTHEAYEAAPHRLGELKFASQSFVPVGSFPAAGDAEQSPQAMAMFTGHVVAAGEKTNSLTRRRYLWAQVDTLGGSFDVVIDPALCDGRPQAGGVLSGLFWLCGRPAQSEPPARHSLFKRLFGR